MAFGRNSRSGPWWLEIERIGHHHIQPHTQHSLMKKHGHDPDFWQAVIEAVEAELPFHPSWLPSVVERVCDEVANGSLAQGEGRVVDYLVDGDVSEDETSRGLRVTATSVVESPISPAPIGSPNLDAEGFPVGKHDKITRAGRTQSSEDVKPSVHKVNRRPQFIESADGIPVNTELTGKGGHRSGVTGPLTFGATEAVALVPGIEPSPTTGALHEAIVDPSTTLVNPSERPQDAQECLSINEVDEPPSEVDDPIVEAARQFPWLRAYIDYCASMSDAPLRYHLLTGLALLAAAAGNTYRMYLWGIETFQ